MPSNNKFYRTPPPDSKARFFDLVFGMTAIESKVGRISAGKFIKKQIDKDIEALLSGNKELIIWMSTESPITKKSGFTKGLTDYAENELKKHGLSKKLIVFEKSPLTPEQLIIN